MTVPRMSRLVQALQSRWGKKMIRTVLVLALLGVLFLLLRSAIRELRRVKGERVPIPRKDVMVQDPVCLSYVPKSTAVAADVGGQTYFFCSRQCAQSFQERLSS